MYRFDNYANMIRDEVRVRAYREAIDQAVGPDSVVLDLGAGTGAFALYAAVRGARHVYAVETNPLIHLGRLQAKELGVEERMTFFHGSSENFEAPERATVLISDVRGALPFLGNGRDLIEDARTRLLTGDATIMPRLDRLYIAPVSHAEWYRQYVEEPWAENALEMPMPMLRRHQASTPIAAGGLDWRGPLPAQGFGEIDYTRAPEALPPVNLRWQAETQISLHALLLWFETELVAGVGFSAAPGGPSPWVYGRLLLPLEQPLDVLSGDEIRVKLGVWRLAGDYAYTWHTQLRDRQGIKLEQRQNSARDLFVQQSAGKR